MLYTVIFFCSRKPQWVHVLSTLVNVPGKIFLPKKSAIKSFYSTPLQKRVSFLYCLVLSHSYEKRITVEPLLMDTSLIWTPLYYGQFRWSRQNQCPYNLYKD